MSYRKKNKLHNSILKVITGIAIVTWVIGACSLDSPDAGIPIFMCLVSSVWLGAFVYANSGPDKKQMAMEGSDTDAVSQES